MASRLTLCLLCSVLLCNAEAGGYGYGRPGYGRQTTRLQTTTSSPRTTAPSSTTSTTARPFCYSRQSLSINVAGAAVVVPLAFFNTGECTCQQVRDQVIGSGLIGAFVPQCDETGGFQTAQLYGSAGLSFCVDSFGNQISEFAPRGTAANCS